MSILKREFLILQWKNTFKFTGMKNMELYLAPMEGITTYIYRNAHAKLFGGCDAYYAPFIVPSGNEKLRRKSLRDIAPENNSVNLKVQVMCTTNPEFENFVRKIKEIGYNEVNLNLGCPSGTVVKKARGSGALKNLDTLDEMLCGIFDIEDIKISIKTRAGFYSHDEFEDILKIYAKYPLSKLIVHPRVREEYYKGKPNLESFKKAYEIFKNKLCYNGDIYSVYNYNEINEKFPGLDSIMIGRGCVRNPAIFREIRGGKRLSTAELINFSNILEKEYLKIYRTETNVLHKLKEIWMQVGTNYPEENKIIKAVKKAGKLTELNSAVNSLPELT